MVSVPVEVCVDGNATLSDLLIEAPIHNDIPGIHFVLYLIAAAFSPTK